MSRSKLIEHKIGFKKLRFIKKRRALAPTKQRFAGAKHCFIPSKALLHFKQSAVSADENEINL